MFKNALRVIIISIFHLDLGGKPYSKSQTLDYLKRFVIALCFKECFPTHNWIWISPDSVSSHPTKLWWKENFIQEKLGINPLSFTLLPRLLNSQLPTTVGFLNLSSKEDLLTCRLWAKRLDVCGSKSKQHDMLQVSWGWESCILVSVFSWTLGSQHNSPT